MMTDPIADMLTRIRNANMARLPSAAMPSSKLKESIAQILTAEGFIEGFAVEPKGPGRELTVQLKYGEDRRQVINGLKRISKPGRRLYSKVDDLPRSQGGLGVILISTSQGLLVDRDARRRKLGGEILCEVW